MAVPPRSAGMRWCPRSKYHTLVYTSDSPTTPWSREQCSPLCHICRISTPRCFWQPGRSQWWPTGCTIPSISHFLVWCLGALFACYLSKPVQTVYLWLQIGSAPPLWPSCFWECPRECRQTGTQSRDTQEIMSRTNHQIWLSWGGRSILESWFHFRVLPSLCILFSGPTSRIPWLLFWCLCIYVPPGKLWRMCLCLASWWAYRNHWTLCDWMLDSVYHIGLQFTFICPPSQPQWLSSFRDRSR